MLEMKDMAAQKACFQEYAAKKCTECGVIYNNAII